jgi:hypothetical protein
MRFVARTSGRLKFLYDSDTRFCRVRRSPVGPSGCLKSMCREQVLSLCQSCAKTQYVSVVEVSFRAKSRCPKLLETNEREHEKVWSRLGGLQSRRTVWNL